MSEYEALQRKLASGWNTWNTLSIFSRVRLAQGFAVNLTFRDGSSVLHGGYIGHYHQTEEGDLGAPAVFGVLAASAHH